MAQYDAEIAALVEALATGAKRVQYRSGNVWREVEFDSLAALKERIAYLQGLQGAPRRPIAGFASFNRGDR